MGQWELNEYQCRCGCGKTWRALKQPTEDDRYALANHRPTTHRLSSFNWPVAWALKLDGLFEDKRGETETVDT